MTPGPDVARVMDVHAGKQGQAAWDFFFRFFADLDALDKHVTVEGGWAVAAHGSPIPSVDLDVLVHVAELDGDREYYDLLHGEGRYARSDVPSSVDWSELDQFNVAWATSRGYDRRELLDGRTIDVLLRAPDGRERRITVPTIPALLVMKLKAFRDRSRQHAVMKDAAEVASYDPTDIAVIHKDPNYRLRKAAKDLVDLGSLWERATPRERDEATALLAEFGLTGLVQAAFEDVDDDVLAAAHHLFTAHRLPGTAIATRDTLLAALSAART